MAIKKYSVKASAEAKAVVASKGEYISAAQFSDTLKSAKKKFNEKFKKGPYACAEVQGMGYIYYNDGSKIYVPNVLRSYDDALAQVKKLNAGGAGKVAASKSFTKTVKASSSLKVKPYVINKGQSGEYYGLKNAEDNQVLHSAPNNWKSEKGAINWAKKKGYEVVDSACGKKSVKAGRYSDAVPYENRKYWYFTTHGIGPGMLPKGVNVLDTQEGQNRKGTWGDYILLDAILNTDELREYDLVELAPLDKEPTIKPYKNKNTISVFDSCGKKSVKASELLGGIDKLPERGKVITKTINGDPTVIVGIGDNKYMYRSYLNKASASGDVQFIRNLIKKGEVPANAVKNLGYKLYTASDDVESACGKKSVKSSKSVKKFGIKASKSAKKRVSAAQGYWADDLNAENNRKILQTLRDAIADKYDSCEIGAICIVVYDVQSGVRVGNYSFEVEFVNVDTTDDISLYVASSPESRGKLVCVLTEYGLSEPYGKDISAQDTFTIPMSGSKNALSQKIEEIAEELSTGSVEGACGKKRTVKASAAAKKRKAIKASGIQNDIVMYFNGDNVYQGSVYDLADAIENLCYDDEVNAKFQEWCNQFGDPFDFDGSPIDTARVFTDIIIHEAEESPVSEDGQSEFYVDGNGILDFEIAYADEFSIEGAKSIKCWDNGNDVWEYQESYDNYYDEEPPEHIAKELERLAKLTDKYTDRWFEKFEELHPGERFSIVYPFPDVDEAVGYTLDDAEYRPDEIKASIGITASTEVNAELQLGRDKWNRKKYNWSDNKNSITDIDGYVKDLADGVVERFPNLTYDISDEAITFTDETGAVVYIQPIDEIVPEKDDLDNDITELGDAIQHANEEADWFSQEQVWDDWDDDPDYATRAVELSRDINCAEETVDIDDLEYITGDTSAEDRIFDVIIDKLRASELSEFGEVDILGGDADIKVYPDGADIDYIIAFIADPIAIGLEDRFMKYVKHPNYNDLNSTQQINGLTTEIIVHNGVIRAVNYVDLDDYDLSNYDIPAYEKYVERLARPVVEEIYNFVDQAVYDGNITSSTNITADADDDLPDMGYGFDSNGDPVDESTVEELERIAQEILDKSEIHNIDEYADLHNFNYYASIPYIQESFDITFTYVADFYELSKRGLLTEDGIFTTVAPYNIHFNVRCKNGEVEYAECTDVDVKDNYGKDVELKNFNLDALVQFATDLVNPVAKDIYYGTTNI